MNNKIIKATPFGSIGVIWTVLNDNPKIIRILLSKPGLSAENQVSRLYPNSRASSCAKIDDIATSIKGFLEGEEIEFSLDVVKLSLCTGFQQLVLHAEHRIPRGSISTYQLIAKDLGKSNGAQAVGNALAHNPFPLIVPCHRAIRSDRHLGGYQGGLEMIKCASPLKINAVPGTSQAASHGRAGAVEPCRYLPERRQKGYKP